MPQHWPVLSAEEFAVACDRGEMVLHYQPVTHIRSGIVRGVEALLRWRHPEAGMLTAAEFLTGFETTPVMPQVTQFALTTACTAVASQAPATWTVSVNISAADAASQDLLPLVTSALEASGLAPERLTLEITEKGVLLGHAEAGVVLTQLRALGVGVSLDDFGTGFSSLTLLRVLPITELKIDRVFVAQLETETVDAAIVHNVIHLANAFQAAVVAEGVETSGQAALLAQLGCQFGQGYLWSRAAPLQEILAMAPSSLLRTSGWQPPDLIAERVRLLAREGASSNTIAAALNRDGINTPDDKRWHGSSVAKLLRQLSREASQDG